MATFDATVRKQLDLHHRISRTIDNMKKLGKDNITSTVINTRLQSIESYWNKFQSHHDALLAAQTEETESIDYFSSDYYTRCEEAFLSAKVDLLEFRDQLGNDSRQAEDLLNSSISRNHVARALPRISLPTFSGDYNKWPPFRDLFTSMISSNADIPPVEKLHYLKGYVAGEAARLISNLAITAGNFARAWDALVARYDNKRILVNSYLDQLFIIQAVTRKSADDLKELIGTVREALGGLHAMGAPVESWDYFIVYFTTRRLDPDSREAWELEQGNTTEPAPLSRLEEFLDGRIRALELVSPRVNDKPRFTSKSIAKTKPPSRVHAATVSFLKCSCCNDNHYISNCPSFSSKSIDERREVINSKRLCINCLGMHKVSECRTTKRCRLCGGLHHTMIHRSNSISPSTATGNATTSAPVATISTPTTLTSTQSAISMHSSTHPIHSQPSTLLATACVQIVIGPDRMIRARALLDQGSELSFVNETLAQHLRLPRKPANIPILGVGSRHVGSTRGAIDLRIRSCLKTNSELNVRAHILPKLTGRLPSSPIATTSWRHTRDLPLADPSFAKSGKIDLVLGADIYGQLLRPSIRQGSSDQPVAQETLLGWILSGPTRNCPSNNFRESSVYSSYAGTPDYELNELLSRFWAQEDVTSGNTAQLNDEEEQCENHFVSTHSRLPTGRYIVRLPFQLQAPALGNPYGTAQSLLRKVKKRLSTDSDFSRLYIKFLCEYEALGHMTRVPAIDMDRPGVVFLPHHGVLREDRTTTKLRVVFNGSCRT